MRRETFEYLRARLRSAKSDRILAVVKKSVEPLWVTLLSKRLKVYRRLVDRRENRVSLTVERESKPIMEAIMLHREDEALKLLKKFESKKP